MDEIQFTPKSGQSSDPQILDAIESAVHPGGDFGEAQVLKMSQNQDFA
jgi:hypothetical protein